MRGSLQTVCRTDLVGGETGPFKIRVTDRSFLEGLHLLHGDQPYSGFMTGVQGTIEIVARLHERIVTQHDGVDESALGRGVQVMAGASCRDRRNHSI